MAWEEVGGYGGGYDDRGSVLTCHRVRVTAAVRKYSRPGLVLSSHLKVWCLGHTAV